MKRKCPVIIIRRSCLTGKVVWIYKGPSRAAARVAYYRACRREIAAVRNWSETAAQRRANIMRVLNDCLNSEPMTAELPPKQKAAVRQLLKLSKEDIACHREFYDHIIEERRRREEAKKIRNSYRQS